MGQGGIRLALERVACSTVRLKLDFRGPGFGSEPQLFREAVIAEATKRGSFCEELVEDHMFQIHWQLTHSVAWGLQETLQARAPSPLSRHPVTS